MKGPATAQERVERARTEAATALASFLCDRRPTEQIDRLVAVALQDYRLRYPAFGRRATNTWLFYDGNPRTARITGTPERVDVYCLFCRVLLVHPAVWDHDYTHRLSGHTTICALRSLAGLMTPGAPGTYRLPSDLDGENGTP
jgi:hypothetical protein